MITSAAAGSFSAKRFIARGRDARLLRLAGWLFANKSEMTEGRSDFNLEPNREEGAHAHIDQRYRELHLANLEKRYETWVKEHISGMVEAPATR